MKEINWLHFSDIHVGCGCHDWMWPPLKLQLFEDLTKQFSVNGPWDVVFFTGDLTFSGSQFTELETLLEEVWKLFNFLGCNPKLVVVPGNHDLTRPGGHNSTAKVLQNWKNENEVQQLFWSGEDNEYKVFVRNLFKNFEEWQKTSKLPMADLRFGILPGDFSTQIVVNDLKMGIVGLNTSFLHFSDTFKENSLELHQIQLNTVLNSNQGEWLGENNFSVLMTHHDPDWLNSNSKGFYNSSIFPPGSFSIHLCGHLHDPKSIVASEGGSSARTILKGPSLFGLEKWGEINDRTLGYTAGKFILDGDKNILRFWPRKLVRKIAGNYKVEADQGYEINNEFVTIYLKKHLNIDVLSSESSIVPGDGKLQDLEENKQKLHGIPKFPILLETQHQSVRVREREALRDILTKDRCGWVIADWGLGKDGFIRRVIYEATTTNVSTSPFVISLPCDELTSFDDLLDLVDEYCNMSLQELCHLASDMPLFLIFDNLPPDLSNKSSIQKLDNLFQTIIDFSDKFVVIAVNRLPVQGSRFEGVEIKALNIPELRLYVSSHPRNNLESVDVDFLERLNSMAQGLPLYVDYILKLLSLSSLDDLYELDFDFSIKNIENEEKMPHGFRVAVANLLNSRDEQIKRSFEMIKVLTLLANGETFIKIKRFYHSKPFYLSNVTTLVDFGLLDVLPIYTHANDIAPKTITYGDNNVSKLLRVPRQVRDYIKSLIPEEEILDIIKTSADFLFGASWRQGKIRMSGTSFFKTHGAKPIGLGNEHIVAKNLLWLAIKNNDQTTLKQASLLGRSYCNLLYEEDRYRDAAVAAEELCHFLADTSDLNGLLHLKLTLARALRMISKGEQALVIFKTLSEDESNIFSKDEMASIYLNIALIEEKGKNKDEALAAAKKVQQLTSKNSSLYNQATTIIINFKENDSTKDKQLRQLQVRCRNSKQFAVANNICIDLASKADSDVKISLLDTVINCDSGDYYNKVRAIVAKVNHLATPDRLPMITAKDCINISVAYSYLFSQRFKYLFNNCHEAVWKLLQQDSQYGKILKLFMHSSFLWRIRGDHETELQYIDKIQKLQIDNLLTSSKEYKYFYSRLVSISPPASLPSE